MAKAVCLLLEIKCLIIEITELASPVEEASVLFTRALLMGGEKNSLGMMPTFKGMMDWRVALF